MVPSTPNLVAENRRLKAELDALKQRQAPIQVDPEKGSVSVRDLKTPDFTVEKLELTSDGVQDATTLLSSLDSWVGGRRPNPRALGSLMDKTLKVQEMKLRVPYETVARSFTKIAGSALRKKGISELTVGPGDKPNEIRVRGKAKRFLTVDFEAKGTVTALSDGRARFQLHESRVGSFAMPNFVAQLGAALLAGDLMKELGTTQQGDSFVIDPSALLPPNLDAQVGSIITDKDGFIIQS